MSDEIIKVLDAICDKFGIAIDWTSKNVIPYVEQLCEHIVHYELWTSSIYTVLSLIILIAGTAFCIHKFKKSFTYDKKNWDVAISIRGSVIIALIVIYMLFLPLLITQFDDTVTAITFPEKTILEFVTSYIENN